MLVFYSSATGNTERFVRSLGGVSVRIEKETKVDAPFVLVTPTFADGEGKGAVPKSVIRFLNDPDNRRYIRGVISGGNRNFGATFGLAGEVIAKKCSVPHLYRFELAGTEKDVDIVKEGLRAFWEKEEMGERT